MMPHDYPTGTYIKCVMVTGEGHGTSYLRSPGDAHGFKMQKIPPLPTGFLRSSINELPEIPQPEVIHYEPFLELWSREGFIRLFAPYGSRREAISFLQVADALRIAGIESVAV